MTASAQQLADGLLLSLRTCATHPAGPLRAVAALVENADAVDPADVERLVRERIAEADMPEDRRWTIECYLTAVFASPKLWGSLVG